MELLSILRCAFPFVCQITNSWVKVDSNATLPATDPQQRSADLTCHVETESANGKEDSMCSAGSKEEDDSIGEALSDETD